MEFKDKLKTLRKKAGITQVELAQQIYVSRSAVAKWESGLGLPNKESLALIAQCFNVSEGEILGNAEAEMALIGKNRTIARQNAVIVAVAAVSAVIIAVLSIMVFFTFGEPTTYFAVVDGVRYELNEDGTYYSACGLDKPQSVGNQKYKRIIVIADEIDKIPVRTISQYAFYDTSCEELYFGTNLERIEYGAFCKARIGGNLHFEGCNNLTIIEESAFAECHLNFTSLQLPEGLITVKSGAFANCFSLKEVVFGRGHNGILTVEAGAFSCTSLERVEFHGLATVGAFGACYNLREIGIFGDVTFTDSYNSFVSLYNLEVVRYIGTYDEFIEKYESVFWGLDFQLFVSDYFGPGYIAE